MQSLIEQVKRLAEAQKRVRRDPPRLLSMTWEHGIGIAVPVPEGFDFPALLAHLERAQAVVDAARELRKLGPLAGSSLRASVASVEAAIVALDAALENLENNDGK